MATETAFSPGTMRQHGKFPATLVEPEKTKIPLVRHIITDEDIGTVQGAPTQPVNLSKVVKLLTDPHSAMLLDRHVHALKKVTKQNSQGFLMRDLVTVFKLLNICADRIDEQPMYIEPMCEILQILRLPYLKEKTSDATSFEQIAIESVAQLGYLMRVPCKEVRQQICQTLVNFYCEKPLYKEVQKCQASTLTYNQKIVAKSDVAETLVKSLALLENDLDVRLAVLGFLQKLSKDSESNCKQILAADGAKRLCSRLMDPDATGQLLFRSADILWNLLELGPRDDVSQQLNNRDCIIQLRDAFIQQLTQGYSHYDRQLRNDLLILASLVAEVCVESMFVETGFAKQLTLFTTFQEVKSHNVLVKHLKLGQSHEDFELKKLLINMVVLLSKNASVMPVLSEGHLMLALFSYVKSNEKTSGPHEWTVAQFEELQLHAMAALCHLGPLMIDDYMTCQGSTRLLLLLEWCVSSDDFHGQGNSFHGFGGRGNKRSQMHHCLRLMRGMVSTGEDMVLQDFMDQGAVNQITGILQNLRKSKVQDASINVEMQCDMLFILSALCEGDVHRKELFGQQGVDVVVDYLKINPKKLTSGIGHHKLMLTAVDCIWCAVVGCYVTEDYFLECEGIFLLIDLLETCPKNMHNLVLGCLLDICENPKSVPHVNAWRGNKDVSAAHLFCDIWRQEEREIGVKRKENYAIADVNHPLMGSLQQNLGVIPLPSSCPSQAIVDVHENMRAKLYALFCKIGFTELPGLCTEDYITLTNIEHYYDLKLGEVWSEVIAELEQEGVRPVTPDQEALEAISRIVADRTQAVAETQKQLSEAQLQQDLIDEQEFYAEIRENHRQKEKAIRDFTDFVARTSNYGLLKAAKERQELSIDASRVQTNYRTGETHHSTEIPNLQTTAFSSRNVAIESTPLELTGGALATYDSKRGTLPDTSQELS